MDPTRRRILKTGAAATVMAAAAPGVFGQQSASGGAGSFYEEARSAFITRNLVPVFR